MTRSTIIHRVAGIINQSSPALLISEGRAMEDFLSLSYLLNPKTRVQLVENRTSEIVIAGRNIFLFRPSKALRKDLVNSYSLELLHEHGGLWQLKQRSTFERGGLG